LTGFTGLTGFGFGIKAGSFLNDPSREMIITVLAFGVPGE
jgi:hypothetical protein